MGGQTIRTAEGWLCSEFNFKSHFYFQGNSLCGLGPVGSKLQYEPRSDYCHLCDDALERIETLNGQYALDRINMRKRESNAR
jgi:hypothetical protein